MNAKLYRCATILNITDNTPALATWILFGNVRDVNLNLERGRADITIRGNNGWRASAPTLKDGTIETEMIWAPADADFIAIETAYFADAEIALCALDGLEATVGSQGLASNFVVLDFTRSEPLEDALKVSVTFAPSSVTSWYTVAA